MTTHRDLALRLLIGRTMAVSGRGLPWSLEEDRRLIEEERSLWGRMTEGERSEEQAWLSALWSSGPTGRRVLVPVDLGGGEIEIVDGAFGPPRVDHRPGGSGVGAFEAQLRSWGFRVIGREGGVWILDVGDAKRLVAESKRLVRLSGGRAAGEVLGCYDPGSGRAWIEVSML